MSEQGGLSRSRLSFKFGQAPAILSLGFSSIWPFSSQALSTLFPTSSTTSCPTTTASSFFFKWSIWKICLNCPPQSPLSTVSLFQPFLDMHLSQLLTNKTKTTPQTNQSFGFPYASWPFWQYPLVQSEGHGHLQRAVLCSHAKRRVRKQVWAMADTSQGAKKGFCYVHHHLPSTPSGSQVLCVVTQKAKPCCRQHWLPAQGWFWSAVPFSHSTLCLILLDRRCSCLTK